MLQKNEGGKRMADEIIDFTEAVLSYLGRQLSKEKLVRKQRALNEIKDRAFLRDVVRAKKGTEIAWARLVYIFWNDYRMLKRLHRLSPWDSNNSSLVRLDYGPGFLRYFDKFPKGALVDIDEAQKIIEEKDWILGDNDRYLIVMGLMPDKREKAFWIGNPSGFKCRDGLRRSLKKPRRKDEWTEEGTPEQRAKFCF